MQPLPTFLIVALCWLSSGRALQINKATGAYEDIVVAIHPSVKYDERIIDNIKALFRSASSFLHQATRGRVHFGSVTIAIPDTWPARPQATATTASLFPVADVRVAAENPQYGDAPYTLQPRGCGERGEYIHLTPRFLSEMNDTIAEMYGSPAYQLVHEWAHFRYGVFEEYGDPESFRYPSLYCEFGMVRANTCSDRIKFTVYTDSGEPCRIYKGCRVSSKCKAQFAVNAQDPVTSSIMFMPYLEGVSEFCDNGTVPAKGKKHNAFAPNKQNHLCDRKSTWEVISSNEDFSSLPPADVGKVIEVNFKEVQKEKGAIGRIIFALDVSGSMDTANRIHHLRVAAAHFLQVVIPNGLELGLVTFSSGAYQLSTLTFVDTESRRMLVERVKNLRAHGGTCIGCALQQCLEMFKGNDDTRVQGSVIMLMTDGEENDSPYIADVIDQLIEEHVVVNTIAFGTQAEEKLEQLARRTGGKAFALRDGQSNIAAALESAFFDVTVSLLDDDRKPVVIFEESAILVDEQRFNVTIDGDVGNETKVTVLCNKASTLKPGTWTLVVLGRGGSEHVHVRVTSVAGGASADPVLVRAFVKRPEVQSADQAVIYAEVSKGPHAVLHARVTATVIRPKKPDPVEVEIFDDGLGADVTANDGIYSAYFTQFEGTGRYSVTARVVSGRYSVIAKGRKAAGRMQLGSGAIQGGKKGAVTSVMGTVEGIPLNRFVYVDEDIAVAEPWLVSSDDAPAFVRYAEGGSFRVSRNIDEASIPPGSINDLTVEDASIVDNSTRIIILSWTCPGAHLNSGNASRVVLRATTRLADLVDDFNSAVDISANATEHGIISAAAVGSKQTVTLCLPDELWSAAQNESRPDFYIAAKVWNQNGLQSVASNVVRVTFERPPLFRAVSGDWPWWLLFAIIATVLAVVAAIIAAAVCVIKRRKQRCKTSRTGYEKRPTPLSNNGDLPVASRPVAMIHNSRITATVISTRA
ncbi:calcium-activated chloride channel regulator 3A-1-like isoform X2 [Haemaphysalis longicornis]